MHEAIEPENGYVQVAGKPHLLLAHVLRELRIDRRTAYRWRDTGKLTFRYFLGRVCCPVDQVLALALEQKQKQEARNG